MQNYLDTSSDLASRLLVDLRTAAALLSVSTSTLYRLSAAGELPIRHIGRKPIILSADIHAYVKSLWQDTDTSETAA